MDIVKMLIIYDQIGLKIDICAMNEVIFERAIPGLLKRLGFDLGLSGKKASMLTTTTTSGQVQLCYDKKMSPRPLLWRIQILFSEFFILNTKVIWNWSQLFKFASCSCCNTKSFEACKEILSHFLKKFFQSLLCWLVFHF